MEKPIFLVIKVRLHAFLVLIVVSLLTAIATGLPLGALGRLIESSGGARVVYAIF